MSDPNMRIHSTAMNLSRIREGLCPTCPDQPLERVEATVEDPHAHGRCPRCGDRWSIRGNEIRVHFVFDDPRPPS